MKKIYLYSILVLFISACANLPANRGFKRVFIHETHGEVMPDDPRVIAAFERCEKAEYGKGIVVEGDLIRNRMTLLRVRNAFLDPEFRKLQLKYSGDKLVEEYEKIEKPPTIQKIIDTEEKYQLCLSEKEGWVEKNYIYSKKSGEILKEL